MTRLRAALPILASLLALACETQPATPRVPVTAPPAAVPNVQPLDPQSLPDTLPPAAVPANTRKSQVRGVWLVTVGNGDWPSRRDLTTDQQKDELIAILDRAAELNLNAIYFQVRPAADAIYPSPLEPWSEYLTGQAGAGPQPPYDPLAFAIQAAHARGLELHAWLNPFRARHPTATGPIATSHVARTGSSWVRQYGKHLWMDPGDLRAQKHSLDVIADIVRRYPVDGVHVDDYFYPYPEQDAAGDEIEFPDELTFRAYRAAGGRLERNDWRRENINYFVRGMYAVTKSIRPAAQVSVSPFGIWRPGHPQQIRGFDAYDRLYADARHWLQQGWVDYLVPQLYWPIDQQEQSFPVLLDWWLDQDVLSRGIVAGMSIHRIGNGRPNSITADEIRRQLEILSSDPRSAGFILFSAKVLMQDRGGVNSIIRSAGVR